MFIKQTTIVIVFLLCVIGAGIYDISKRLHEVQVSKITDTEIEVLSNELLKYANIYDCKTLYITKSSDTNKLNFDCTF